MLDNKFALNEICRATTVGNKKTTVDHAYNEHIDNVTFDVFVVVIEWEFIEALEEICVRTIQLRPAA